jgi:hypothetical protein
MATKAFNTDKFSEKVLAISTYDSSIITNLYQNPVNREKINRGAAFVIKNYFEGYVDSQAAQNPSAYHHVYEFDKTGDKNARLFKGTVTSDSKNSFINFKFTRAKNPNRQGYAFPNKADVMEKNDPITITPKERKYLTFRLKDGRFVSTTESFVRNPGGPEVAGSFEKTFNNFMIKQANAVLTKFGYFKRIELGILERRRLIIPRINSGVVRDSLTTARRDASQIAGGISTYYV